MGFDILAIVRIVVWVFIILICFRMIYRYIIRKKESTEVLDDISRIDIAGKPNVSRLKLGSLLLSDDGEKRVNAGKIVAFARIRLNDEETNCFVVKSGWMNPPKHYIIGDNELSGEIKGDVLSTQWNFRLDKKTNFYVPNDFQVITIKPMSEGMSIGVNTLAKFAPLVHSSINANPIHRIRLRETRLIR